MKITQQNLVSRSILTSGIERRRRSRRRSQTTQSAIAATNPILMQCQAFQAWFVFPNLRRLGNCVFKLVFFIVLEVVITNWRLCANRKDSRSLYRFRKEAWSSRKKLPDTTSTITTTVITITTTIITTTINLGSTRYSVFANLPPSIIFFSIIVKNHTQWSKQLQLQKKSKPRKFQITWRQIKRSKDELPTFLFKIIIPKVILIFFKVFVPKNSNPYLFIYYV